MLFTGVAKGAQGAGPCPLLIEELKKEEYGFGLCHLHNLPLIMAFNVQKLPYCPPPPSPLTNPGYTTITGVAKGDTRAHSPIPPLIGEFKKGGGLRRRKELGIGLCHYKTYP